MNASKENAAKAREAVEGEPRVSPESRRQFIAEFIAACEKKLPSEAAYAKEAQRNKTKKRKMAKV